MISRHTKKTFIYRVYLQSYTHTHSSCYGISYLQFLWTHPLAPISRASYLQKRAITVDWGGAKLPFLVIKLGLI